MRPVAADWHEWFRHRRDQVDRVLAAHLSEIKLALPPHSRLPDAVVYSVQVGGKRVRPILVLETCLICGGRVEAAHPAALAIELLHTFSLIHDDLPALDNDDLRRGQPTNHKVFGEALALLAGDWLSTHAFALLSSSSVEPAIVPALVQTLADATQRMIEGQSADIAGENQPTDPELVRYIHLNKTAALLECCCRFGALCAGASAETISALARYGRHLGLAFQIADDLLDARGTTEKMGKRVGKDQGANKQTWPAAFGIEQSDAQARTEAAQALAALAPFGCGADRLRDLVRFVINRDN